MKKSKLALRPSLHYQVLPKLHQDLLQKYQNAHLCGWTDYIEIIRITAPSTSALKTSKYTSLCAQ